MASSTVELVNRVLIKLNQKTITSLTDDSDVARAANAVWNDVRREVLGHHGWTSARKRASLVKLSTAPAYEYTYQYQLPSDFIRLVEPQFLADEYTIEGNKILSDWDSLNILYIFDLTDVNSMSPELQAAIRARLASALSGRLSMSKAEVQRYDDEYERVLQSSVFLDSTQQKPHTYGGRSLLDARHNPGASHDPPFRDGY